MPLDVFMIAFGEPNAAQNWARLKSIAPQARLIENVRGFHECHAAAAAASSTPHFFAVDADNWVLDGFCFELPFEPRADEIAIWNAINPINGLSYGHGGIKLFAKSVLARKPERELWFDFFMSLGKPIRVIDTPASEHRFNTDPQTTWSAAFRECVKLAMMTEDGTPETRARALRYLQVWCSQGAEGQYASWCLKGAEEGCAYADRHRGDRAALARVNDYDWMRARFREQHVRKIVIPSGS